MLQRQIVRILYKQIDIEDAICIKDAIASFDFIACIFISVIVTNNRTVPLHRCQRSHNITMTANLNRNDQIIYSKKLVYPSFYKEF